MLANEINSTCRSTLHLANSSRECETNHLRLTMSCEACRTIPPVIATGYTPKGHFESIAGLNTCKSTLLHCAPSPSLTKLSPRCHRKRRLSNWPRGHLRCFWYGQPDHPRCRSPRRKTERCGPHPGLLRRRAAEAGIRSRRHGREETAYCRFYGSQGGRFSQR